MEGRGMIPCPLGSPEDLIRDSFATLYAGYFACLTESRVWTGYGLNFDLKSWKRSFPVKNIIYITDRNGHSKAELSGEREVVLAWEGKYEPGDSINMDVAEPGFYVIRVDDCVDESLVYLKETTMHYPIIFDEKKEAHNPKAFTGERHYLSLRPAEPWELGYRNLALNPADQHDVVGCYPHASANVETRGESVFAARNAIDGTLAVRGHGRWPYASWGINMQDDAAFTLDFGRPVDFDTVVLYTRADFPHDNWWNKVTFTFSDGTTQEVTLEKSYEPHKLSIARKNITWLRLDNLIKADDPSPFPALTQIQVFGTDSKV